VASLCNGLNASSGTYALSFPANQAGCSLSLYNSTGTTGAILFGKTNSANNCGTIGYVHAGDGFGTNYLGFGTYGTDNTLNVVANGRVGVGTTSPAYRLDVNGTARVNSALALHNKLLVLWDNNPADAVDTATDFYGFGINGGTLRYQTASGGVHSFYVGGQGIATVSTNALLTVSSLRVFSTSTICYFSADTTNLRIYNLSAGVYLTQNSGSWATWSDARMKKNVRPLEYGLSALERLEPVRFDYLSDAGSNNSSRLGFVAQNVLPAVPEAVTGSGTDKDMYGLQMTDLIPVCVNAIKELSAEVAKLRAELAIARADIERLEIKKLAEPLETSISRP
jgi:hypothetical protein